MWQRKNLGEIMGQIFPKNGKRKKKNKQINLKIHEAQQT